MYHQYKYCSEQLVCFVCNTGRVKQSNTAQSNAEQKKKKKALQWLFHTSYSYQEKMHILQGSTDCPVIFEILRSRHLCQLFQANWTAAAAGLRVHYLHPW